MEKLFENEEKLEALPLITALKKLCNAPELIYSMYQVKKERGERQTVRDE